VRHIHGTLRTVLECAVADGILSRNPATGVRLPKKVDKDRTWRRTAVFTRDEVEMIISAPVEVVPEDRRVMYALLFVGAMRFGEAAALKWCDYGCKGHPTRQAGYREVVLVQEA
jgi:integrase